VPDLTGHNKDNPMDIYQPLRIYSSDMRPALVTDRAAYLGECAADRDVLHVGCTDWPMTAERLKAGTLLHGRLHGRARSLLGIDISTEGIRTLRALGYDDVSDGDAERLGFTGEFDTVLAGDVLEHLNNPGLFIEGAGRALRPDGELVIAVPCAFTAQTLKTWLRGTEQVHRDHVAYYSPKTLAGLCARYGLSPVFLGFTVQPPDEGESGLFIRMREAVIRRFPTMAPAIIMRFRKDAAVSRAWSYCWE
jgi:SAM-dependent methyltransferase